MSRHAHSGDRSAPGLAAERGGTAECETESMADNLAASGLHPLLASRWSPTTFDTSHELTAAEVDLLLEAARWAPSAGNSQPWALIVGRRGDDTHRRLVRHLYR